MTSLLLVLAAVTSVTGYCVHQHGEGFFPNEFLDGTSSVYVKGDMDTDDTAEQYVDVSWPSTMSLFGTTFDDVRVNAILIERKEFMQETQHTQQTTTRTTQNQDKKTTRM